MIAIRRTWEVLAGVWGGAWITGVVLHWVGWLDRRDGDGARAATGLVG
jgi:hypothetical protein